MVHPKFREQWEASGGRCEDCEEPIDAEFVIDMGYKMVCPSCAEESGYCCSDIVDRAAERRQMGLVDF